MTTTIEALSEVAAERKRQDAKWGEQNHADGVGDDVRLLGDVDLPTHGTLAYRAKQLVDRLSVGDRSFYAPILLEEVFEALSATSEAELRTELVQVAAVCVQWMEAIDRRQRAARKCSKCDGCGRIADDDDGTPWTFWENLPVKSAAAVVLGLVRPVTCPSCNGSGSVAA